MRCLWRRVRGDGLDWLSILLLAVAVTSYVRLAAACHREAKPPAPPRMVIERRPCMERPPPQPGDVGYRAGGEAACDPSFVMCLPRDAAINLVAYLTALHDWARDAYTACGPPPAALPEAPVPPPDPPPPDAAPSEPATEPGDTL